MSRWKVSTQQLVYGAWMLLPAAVAYVVFKPQQKSEAELRELLERNYPEHKRAYQAQKAALNHHFQTLKGGDPDQDAKMQALLLRGTDKVVRHHPYDGPPKDDQK